MENNIGFFEENPGQKSSTRLNVFIILINGILLVDAVALAGIYKYLYCDNHETLTAIVTAAALLLGTTVIPAAGWKLAQKSQENTGDK